MSSNVDEIKLDDPVSVLYRHNPEWADVTPIEQDDGLASVVSIAYSEKCKYVIM